MLRIPPASLGLIAALAACGGSRAPSTDSASFALTVLSEPTDVEPFPARSPASPAAMKAACGPTQCLLVYELQSELVKGTFLYATRVDRSGQLLDDPPELLSPPPLTGPADGAPGRISTVAAGADGTFLVVWCARGALDDDACLQELYSTRVEADGTFTPLYTAYFQEPATSLTLAGGTGYLLLESNGAVRNLGERGFGDIVTPPMLTRGIVPGEAQFLLLGDGSVARFDPKAGAVLDQQPTRVTSDGAELHGAFSSNAYHLFWESPTTDGGARTLGLRVSRDDGRVLEPNLTETGTPGARVQIDPAPSTFQVVTSPEELLLLSPTSDGLDLWKVNGASGEPSGFRRETRWPGESAPTELVVSTAAGVLLADAEPSSLRVVTTNWGAEFGLAFGAAEPFLFRPEPRLSPFVASNGTDYAVAWRQPSGLYATRLDATSGAYSGAPTRFAELASETGVRRSEARVVVWGDAYKFVFLRASGTDSALVMGDVFTGQLRTLATGVGFDPLGASAVCQGPYCLVAWVKNGATPVLTGVRVDATSVSEPFSIGSGTAVAELTPKLVAEPNPAADQAWVVFSEQTAEVGASTWLRSYRFSTSELGVATPIWSAVEVSAAQSESRLLVFWREPGDLISSFSAINADALTGEHDSSPRRLGGFPSPSNFDLASLWYDGTSFVGLWAGMELGNLRSAFEPHGLLMRLRDGTGLQLLDGYPGTVVSDALPCSGASRGDARSLVACNVPDHGRLGATIKVRLFEHDGQPSFSGGGGTGGLANGARGGEGGSSSKGGTANGGTAGTGAAANAGESPIDAPRDDANGCTCRLTQVRDTNRSALFWLGLALSGLVARRRASVPR